MDAPPETDSEATVPELPQAAATGGDEDRGGGEAPETVAAAEEEQTDEKEGSDAQAQDK